MKINMHIILYDMVVYSNCYPLTNSGGYIYIDCGDDLAQIYLMVELSTKLNYGSTDAILDLI